MDTLPNIDRFHIQQKLGEGSFGQVFEAFDNEKGVTVAIKQLHDHSPEALYNFKHEFRALADVVHPNLVSPFELLSINNQWFFTMELVKGTDFYQYLRGEDPGARPTATGSAFSIEDSAQGQHGFTDLPWEREEENSNNVYSAPPSYAAIRAPLLQLATGLHFLHKSGLLHRDLKPSNVLVTPEGNVKMLDFGLASLRDENGTYQDPISGTPAYMAPELLMGKTGTEASDWYSVGTMLYQVLTGQLPHTGNPLEMTKAKLNYEPCPPSLLLPGVPLDLEELCMGMLQREPELRPKGPEILIRLGGVDGDHAPSPALPSTSGRAREMGILMEAFQQMERGRMRIIHLRGAVGMGKSQLLRRVLREVHRKSPHTLIIQGRCFEQESVPFKALDSLVDALSRHLRRMDPVLRAAILPHHINALARLFPVLHPFVPPTRHAPQEFTPDYHQLRHRAFQALRELLTNLAGQQKLVLTIDDVHWGDVDSATLIAAVLSPPDPPPVLLILTSVDENSNASPMIRRLREGGNLLAHFLEVELKELPYSEARSLATALLGPGVDIHVADQIAKDSGGSPFLIGELVSQYKARGTGPISDLKNHLHEQLTELPEKAAQILKLLAISAGPLPLDVMQEILGSRDETHHHLRMLVNRHLVRVVPSNKRLITLYHTSIREVLLRNITPTQARDFHQALSRALENRADSDPETLATHFEGAHNSAQTAHYASMAAERACAALAFDRACDLFRKALTHLENNSPRLPELKRSLADALSNAGQGLESAHAYLDAVRPEAPKEATYLRRRAAEEFLRSGDLESAIPPLKEVLKHYRESYPGSHFSALLRLFYYRLRLKQRGDAFTLKDNVNPETLGMLDALWAAAMGLSRLDVFLSAAFQAQMSFKALESGDPLRIVRALSLEATFAAHRGLSHASRSAELLAKAHETAEHLNHPAGLCCAHLAGSTVALLEGRWKDCAESNEQTLRTLKERCSGVNHEISMAHYHHLVALFQLGEIREISKSLPLRIQEAQERGNRLALTELKTSLEPAFFLVHNKVDVARKNLMEALQAWPQHRFQSQHFQAFLSRMNIEIYSGQLDAAGQFLSTTWPSIQRSFLLKIQLVRIFALEMKARIHLGLALQNPQHRRDNLKQGDELTHKLENEQSPFASALALQLRALETLCERQPLMAQGFLLQAEHAFEALHMELHVNLARFARCRLEGEMSARALREATDWLHLRGIAMPNHYTYMHLPIPDLRNPSTVQG